MLFDKYEIIDLLSSSAENDVYIVNKAGVDEKYILKSLKKSSGSYLGDISRKIRFKKEIDIVSSFNHPNISMIVDSYLDNDAYFLIYKYKAGKTLAELLKEKKFLPGDALQIVSQLLCAQEYIHARGYIHADINPKNIFVSAGNEVELFDFGLTLREDEAIDIPEGMVIGTLPYVAPEQMGFTDFKIDTRTDLFCTGIIFYQLVTGALPFPANTKNIQDFLNSLLKKRIMPVHNIPLAVNGALLKALHSNPKDRYQTAEGFKYDVDAALRYIKNEDSTSVRIGAKDEIIAINRTKLFVGREDTISLLEEGIKIVTHKKTPSFLLYGKSGIGKTELVRNFIKRINKNELLVAGSKCNRFTSNQPYSIFREIVHELLNKFLRTRNETLHYLRKLINENLIGFSGVINQHIPEMASFFDYIFPVDKIEEEKREEQVIYILSQIILLISEVKPLCIFIDDFQWVDNNSFQIFHNLLSEKMNCMFIFNFRINRDEPDLYLYNHELKNIGIKKIIRVGPFLETEVKELITKRFTELTGYDEFIDILMHRTDLSPFTINEVLRYLINKSVLRKENEQWNFNNEHVRQLPGELDSISLINDKIGALSVEEKTCIKLASIIEGQFDVSLLNRLSDYQIDNIEEILKKLEKQEFLTRKYKGGYTFAHDKIQELINKYIDKEERFRLNEKLAGIYEDFIAEDKEYYFKIAECYLESKNLRKAMEMTYKAAQYAIEKVAFHTAIRYLKNISLMYIQNLQSDNPYPVDVFEVNKTLGELLILTGQNKQALNVFLKLITKPQPRRKQVIYECTYKIGSIYHNMGDFANAIYYFRKALLSLHINIPQTRVGKSVTLVFELFMQLINETGIVKFLPKYQESKYYIIERILNKLCYSYFFNDLTSAWITQLKSINLADRLQNSVEKIEAYVTSIPGSFMVSMKRRAYKYLSLSLKNAYKIKNKDILAYTYCMSGVVYFWDAKWRKAEAFFKKSLAIYKSIGNLTDQIIPLENFALTLQKRGQIEECTRLFERETELAERCNDLRGKVLTKLFLSNLRILKNEFSLQELTELKKLEKVVKDILVNSLFYLYISSAYLLMEDISEAYLHSEKLLAFIKEKNITHLIQEYIASSYANHCEILIKEMVNRKNNLEYKPLINKSMTELLAELRRNSQKALGVSSRYPAHKGAAFRCSGWYYALKGKSRKAQRSFIKAIREHHKLDMKIEEGKDRLDYGLLLEEMQLPGLARDEFTRARRLFENCAAVYYLKQAKEKLDNKFDLNPTRYIHDKPEPVSSLENYSNSITSLHVDTLLKVSHSISEIDDINVLLEQIVRALINATGAQNGYLFLNIEEGQTEKRLLLDYRHQHLKLEDIYFSKDVIDWVKEHKKVLLIKDGSVDERITSEKDKENIKSVLCVPLIYKENYLGCVYLSNDIISNLFTRNAEKAASILSAQASILLENSLIMDRYKKLASSLEEKVREQIKDIIHKNKELEHYNMRLIESERVKNILTDTLVHDIKNYVSGIMGNIELLSCQYEGDTSLQRGLKSAETCCEDIINLSSNLLDISRMEEGKLEVKKNHIHYTQILDIVQRLVYSQILEEKQIQLKIIPPLSENFMIQADTYLLTRILQNLFSNANKYTSSPGIIALSFEDSEDENIITLFNTSPPFTEEQKKVLFDKYTTLGKKSSNFSKGLGLFFCKMVMNAHEGHIWIESHKNGNAFKLGFKKINAAVPSN